MFSFSLPLILCHYYLHYFADAIDDFFRLSASFRRFSARELMIRLSFSLRHATLICFAFRFAISFASSLRH